MLQSLRYLDEHVAQIRSGLSRKTKASADLMSTVLRDFITEDGYEGPEIFEDGIVVMIGEGKIVYPDNSPFIFKNLADPDELRTLEPITQKTLIENGTEREVLVTVKPISENLYYIDWAEMNDYHAAYIIPAYINGSIEALENVYGTDVILLSEEDPEAEPLYFSKHLQDSELSANPAKLSEMTVSKPSVAGLGKNIYNVYYEDLDFSGRKVKALLVYEC